ncbi:hypothetical protein [Desertivirga arenae]|uniref:hypothetical protein n=1 Tax=Desertivirga arenae TaxID=2810309 RepID=UPI001A978AB9|nr:hypothetical protein [Pedobacter sp. SYSU D00823]
MLDKHTPATSDHSGPVFWFIRANWLDSIYSPQNMKRDLEEVGIEYSRYKMYFYEL